MVCREVIYSVEMLAFGVTTTVALDADDGLLCMVSVESEEGYMLVRLDAPAVELAGLNTAVVEAAVDA